MPMRRLGKLQPKRAPFYCCCLQRRSTVLVSNKILSEAVDPRLNVSIGVEEYFNRGFAFAASMGSSSASRGFLEPTRMSSSVCQPRGYGRDILRRISSLGNAVTSS
jgi:hypothetical protein